LIIQKIGNNKKVNYAAGCGRTTNEWTIIKNDYLFTDASRKVKG
jgi:hypothetical protein